jgi:hypothetical protein
MDLARFLSIVQTEAVWFARADLLGDPHEGATGEFNRSQWTEMYGEQMAQGLSSIDWSAMRRKFHISCWHMNDRESAAMWGVYQTEGRGIAIKSSVARLKQAVTGADESVYFAPVQYIDYSSHFVPEGNLFYRFMHKRRSFEYEQELRMMVLDDAPTVTIERNGQVETVSEPGYEPPPGLSVPTSLADLIEGVHVAPGSADWFVDVIRRIVDDALPSTPVVRSEIDAAPLF